MNWLSLIIGLGTQVVPLFIHNAQSQQIEGVVAIEAQNILGFIQQLNAAKKTTATTAAAAATATVAVSPTTSTANAPFTVPVGPKISS